MSVYQVTVRFIPCFQAWDVVWVVILELNLKVVLYWFLPQLVLGFEFALTCPFTLVFL